VRWLAGRLVAAGASPNAISALGMGAAILGGISFALIAQLPGSARPLWLAGAVLVQLRLLANVLDGMVAIGRGVASPLGELFNEVPDRVSDTAILLGFAFAAGGGWALGLAAALAAMSTAYIRAVGRGAGAGSAFCGPMAKQHRMAMLTALAVWCAVAPWAWGTGSVVPAIGLVVIAALSVVTAVRRLWRIARALRGHAAP
jgi:phosphatidylglycerophosphate synthase